MFEEERLPDDEVAGIEVTPEEEIETLKRSLAEERGKTERYLANWQRA